MDIWITALVIGFAGSLHCLAMCSPLAMAVTNFRAPYFTNRLVYNAGRILCYGMLGALVSAFGSLFKFSGFQNILTISLGAALILLGLAGTKYIRIPVITGLVQKGSNMLKGYFSKFLQKNSIFSLTMMGILNGLLPCGLTYLALTYCLTVENAWMGFSFMLVFGAGTLPVMLGLTSGFQLLINRFSLRPARLTTITMIVLGILLITRAAVVHSHPEENSSEIVECK